ncbi:MAG TPA: hypothetical protein VIH10_14090, partial [Kribbella sp.]
MTATLDRPLSTPRSTPSRRRRIRGPVAWFRDPWRPPRLLAALTGIYLIWSLLPVAIAVLFSFNNGRSRTVWQGFSTRWYWGDPVRSV